MTCEFVLVAEHRTGSTFLMSGLNSHEAVFCDNELFNHKAIVHRGNKKNIEQDKKAIWARNADPVKYMEKYFAKDRPASIKAKGFNMMLGNNAFVLMELLKGNYKLIHLHRDNKLAQYSSFLKGGMTQQWATKNAKAAAEQRKDNAKIDFKYVPFERWLHKQNTMSLKFSALCKAGNVDVLEIEYTAVARGNADASICKFLGIEEKTLTSELHKQGSNNILDRFNNPKFARQYLKVLGKPEWAQEVL